MAPRKKGRNTGKRRAVPSPTPVPSSSDALDSVEEAKSDSSFEVGANNPDAIRAARSKRGAEDVNFFFDRKSGEESVCKFCR